MIDTILNSFADALIRLFATLLLVISVASALPADGLPLPDPVVPPSPKLPPTVVTAGGQRLLLEHTDARLMFDAKTQTLTTNRPGWWLINYPLDRISGLGEADQGQIAIKLFGKPTDQIANWYFRAPGLSPEPTAPRGPAPFTPSKNPDWIVNPNNPAASDDNPGTIQRPLATISAAVNQALPGQIVHVYPGIYREAVTIQNAGTSDMPIVLEGIRDGDGNMPRITGNDLAPENAWTPLDGFPNVWRAENWVGRPSLLTLDGNLLKQKTLVSELEDFEYSLNLGDAELAMPRLDGDVNPSMDATQLAHQWRREATDEEGRLQLGDQRGVYYLSTWVWKHPGETNEVWNPNHPEPVTGEMTVKGPFRASKQCGSAYGSQLNPYRFWINGKLMPASTRAGEPIARTGYGQDGDTWMRLPFQEGWNHLVVLLDSRHKKGKSHSIKFSIPKGFEDTTTSATKPSDLSKPGDGPVPDHVSEWMVLGPIESETDKIERAVYLKLPANRDPNREVIDMGKRERALSIEAPFWTVRGFELTHGSQYMQRALTEIKAHGVTLEHCLLRETEVRTLSVQLSNWDQGDAPATIRGNHFRSPGSLGIGCSGNTKLLTAENQSTTAPGRGRMLVEHNVVLNNNRSGFKRLWESGAMKFFRCTGCVIRYNTIVGGDGPGIWFDWEHYSNRVEGNYIHDVPACGIGVEASPGPMLMASNVITDIKPGGAWFERGLLGWSSARLWAVHNTIVSNKCVHFGEGPDDRNSAWKKLPERDALLVNNLLVGTSETIHRGHLRWMHGNRLYGPGELAGINRYSRWPKSLSENLANEFETSTQLAGSERPSFALTTERPPFDFRLQRDSVDASSAINASDLSKLSLPDGFDPAGAIKHDFFGLLRFSQDDAATGAFRSEPPHAGSEPQIEVEFVDGTLRRFR